MSNVAFPLPPPQQYQAHSLHGMERVWPEMNCYIDVWVEIIHALGLNPMAMLPVVLAIDFDGDQWTFFKPSHEDLFQLYGLDVQELNVWKSLLENTQEQLQRGRLVLTEADAYYLPDTQGTDYRSKHTKTTIGIQSLDLGRKQLNYFHNTGYFKLEGEDFDKLLRVGLAHDPDHMPFFAEFVRLDRQIKRQDQELAQISLGLLQKYRDRCPTQNPIVAFRERFLQDIETIQTQGMEFFHAYAFANLRQLGSACELAGLSILWLQKNLPDTTNSFQHQAFLNVSECTKTMLLKMARMVANKRKVDFTPLLDEMEKSWAAGMDQLS